MALVAACTGSGSDDSSSDGGADRSSTTTAPGDDGDGGPVAAALELSPLSVEEGRIVDDEGRQVLLRGANVNAYGEYAQADPETAPTAPVTDDDWDAMAANGFSVVRLIMSWSLLEPERGVIDQQHLDELHEAVDSANDRGIYVVLDMHQDAWGMSSATPTGTTCPDGTEPAIGWDGAPAWATIDDGGTTCLAPGGRREDSAHVVNAFSNFHADTDGIATRLTAVWAAVATEFADEPGVAGYDLLNEPSVGVPAEENQASYSRWIQATIQAIRAAETAVGARSAPVFVEPLQLYPLPNNALLPDVVHDPQLVFAPHNYSESISSILTLEQTFDVYEQGAAELDAALWIGEYGFWDIEPDTLAVAARYAADEDRRFLGGAWWQWRQTCGDPHSVEGPGLPATEDAVHLITRSCGDPATHDTDAGTTEQFLAILGRSYPRAAPGQLTELVSDPASGDLTTAGSGAEAGQQLVVWIPSLDGAALAEPTVVGLDEVTIDEVDGGHLLTARATTGDWRLSLTRG